MPINIAYADDEQRFHKLVKLFLESEGYKVFTFYNGQELLSHLSSHTDVDLVLLDVMMPGLNGMDICSIIRDKFTIPVIMITALNSEDSEIEGIDSGADDYISKPFSKKILQARVKAMLRRIKKVEEKQLGDEHIKLHQNLNRVTVDGREVVLSPKEYKLFKYLMLNSDFVLSREQILNHVWGIDFMGDPRTVDTHIKSLRSKLDEDGALIKTVRGRGYSFTRGNR